MANRIDDLIFSAEDVASSTWTKVEVADPGRKALVIRNSSGSTFFVAYQTVIPTGTGDEADEMLDGDKVFWDAAEMPICNIWAYQTSGGNLNIHVAANP